MLSLWFECDFTSASRFLGSFNFYIEQFFDQGCVLRHFYTPLSMVNIKIPETVCRTWCVIHFVSKTCLLQKTFYFEVGSSKQVGGFT